ncbi:MAG: hypothetical protein Q8L13_20410 [Bradyrhizobium sp.]|uniref:hypothetical protein n=1 Tax=Bradyrhizobium sp. TaxID=376 RepID=UPI00273207A4|nr:hypothetical protein [Bradyrhizobium sp.]MDP1868686.1 hypothetical protein [Bradyrhizobium sp.]
MNEVVIAQGHALERKPSNAWARKIPALNRPKHAVTVSIIAKFLRAPAPTQRHDTAHSQKDFGGGIEDPAGVMLWHNSFAGKGTRGAARHRNH